MPRVRARRKKNALFRNTQDLEHTVDEYMGSLSGFQSDALPVEALQSTTENLVYVARNEKGMTVMGQDPHWDHERVFEGHVRAPLDKKASDYGFVWTEHIYNVNPLAGTGTENISFIAGGIEQQLSEMSLLPTLSAQQGNPIQATANNPVDPTNVQDVLYSQEKTAQAIAEYRAAQERNEKSRTDAHDSSSQSINVPGHGMVDPGLKLLENGGDAKKEGRILIKDRNRLQSHGFLMVNDPAGRHEVFTHDGEPIQYYLDGSIEQAQKVEGDAIGTEPVDDEYEPSEWLQWHGIRVPQFFMPYFPQTDAVQGDFDVLHEDLMSNNIYQNHLTNAQALAAERYTMHSVKTKQMFLDYDRPFDPLALQLWDASDGHQIGVENSSKMFDLVRLM